MAGTASDVLRVAESQLGTTSSAQYTTWFYGRAQSVAWCAIFVSWCMAQAGVGQELCPKYAACVTGRQWFKNRGLFHPRGSYTPKAGDVIFLNWSASSSSASNNHTGIVTGTGNGTVYTIEGNTSSPRQVKRKQYSASYRCIIGYGEVRYTARAAATATEPADDVRPRVVQTERIYTVYPADTPYKPVDTYSVHWTSFATGLTRDISDRAGGLALSDDTDSLCRDLTLSVLQAADDRYLPPLEIACGDIITVLNGSVEIFAGQVNSISGSYRDAMSVQCYDDGRRLTMNDIVIQFSGVPAREAIAQVCARCGISSVEVPALVTTIDQIYQDTASNIVADILARVTAENGVTYFPRMLGKTFAVRSYGQTPLVLWARPAENLAAFRVLDVPAEPQVSWDSSDLRNTVLVHSDSDGSVAVLAALEDPASVQRFGRRTVLETWSDQDGVSATQKARVALAQRSVVAQSFQLVCYGSDYAVAGARVTVDLREIKGDFIIKSVQHELGTPHLMTLTLERGV